MSKHWNQEQRERQSQAIHQWKPWKRSTGPKTEAGKKASSRNAFKHGDRSAEAKAFRKQINDLLRQHREALKRIS